MKGVLLINLGTPNSVSVRDVRKYLAEFLGDPRVIDLPKMVRQILLYGFILPFRPRQTAKAYAKIFDKEKGSPLLYYSEALVHKLQNDLGPTYEVKLGMRYGEPRLNDALEALYKRGCDEIIILPLFAQYASAVNGSAIEAVFHYLKNQITIPSVRVISEFYQRKEYLDLLSLKIQDSLSNFSPDRLAVLLSYHSLPARQIKKSCQGCSESCFEEAACPSLNHQNQSCYRAKCFETSRQLVSRLGLSKRNIPFHTVFQSKLGNTKWIGPDIIETMKALRQKNIKDLVIACPSFTVDCLETLEEIGIRGREQWAEVGGEGYILVPSLNDDPNWAKCLSAWLNDSVLEPTCIL